MATSTILLKLVIIGEPFRNSYIWRSKKPAALDFKFLQLDSGAKISFRSINQLAIPAILSGIAESVISLTDLAMIGHVPHDNVEALAAVGLVGSYLSAIIWVVAQTKTSISALVSQHFGHRRLHAVKTLVPQAILFNFLLSMLLFLLTTVFVTSIFRAYNAEGLILNYAEDYYLIRAIGFPLTLVTFALYGVFRGLQNTVWAMRCSVVGAIVNILLNAVLIYGITGWIPPMHIQGAAIASVVAQVVMLMMAFYYYFTKTSFRLKLGRKINPNLRPFIRMSFNFILRTATLNIAIYLANAYATGYGDAFIAAQSILMNIWLFFSFFIDGYSSAGNALAGRYFGSKDHKSLWEVSKKVRKYAICVALILASICFAFYTPIGRLFNHNADVIAIFKSVFWMVLIMQPINALAYVYDGLFKGLGDARYLRNNLMVATFLGFIPTLWIADYVGLQLHGVWLAFSVWMLIRSFPLINRFKNVYILTNTL